MPDQTLEDIFAVMPEDGGPGEDGMTDEAFNDIVIEVIGRATDNFDFELKTPHTDGYLILYNHWEGTATHYNYGGPGEYSTFTVDHSADFDHQHGYQPWSDAPMYYDEL